MFLSLIIIWILYLSQVFSTVSSFKESDPQTWLADLKYFITEESPTQKLMLIIQNQSEFQDPRVTNIIKALNHVPTSVFNIDHFSEDNTSNFFKLSEFSVSRATTIFIMIVLPKNDLSLKIDQLTTLASKLSRVWTRPRCLVIHLTEERSSYKNILHLAWSRQFLDFTLVELSKANNYVNNSFINYNKYIKATLHFYNPFLDLYTTTPFFPGIEWFPNKLHNLNSQLMKIGVVKFFPYSDVIRDKLGNPLRTSGTDFKIMKTFSEAMNFRIIMPPQQTEDYGIFHCDREKTGGLLWNLTHNEIQMMGLRLSVISSCDGTFSTAMKMTEMVRFCAVIPILFTESKSFFIRWKFFYAVLLIAVILTTTVAVSRFFHFQKNNWSFTQIVSIMLGITVPREPERMKERIIFACFVIACAFYSSNIFAEFTHKVLRTKSERNIDTLEELYKSELTPVMHPSLAYSLSTENEGLAKKFVEKSFKTTDSSEKCLETLIRFKNVTCIMRDVAAKLKIESTMDKCGRARMKIVKQRLWTFPITFFLEPGSPYVNRFDDLMIKIYESGLVDGWNKEASRNLESEVNEEISCDIERENSFNVLQPLYWTLFSGYLASLLTFAWEVVKLKCVK